MGKILSLFKNPEPDPDLHWNRGYSDGYREKLPKPNQPFVYYTGYVVGDTDRQDDEEAVLSGDWEPLSEEERLAIYGDESDKP